MRITWIMATLGLAILAGCTENTGGNPNYYMSDSPYGRYLVAREAALTGTGPMPTVIPVNLPRNAPTPAEIAGQPVTRVIAARVSTPQRARATTRPASGYAQTQTVLQRYAAVMDNNPGEARFARTIATGQDTTRACARFATPDAAQIAFIARGGPQIDPLGLDPDGDGFVCGWDPRPMRKAGL